MIGLRFKYRVLGVFFFISSPLLANDSIFLACDQPQQTGLYKQCQEVKVMEFVGKHARVYARAEQRVLTVPIAGLFRAVSGTEVRDFKSHKKVSIPALILWNNTPPAFQSLCSLEGASGQQFLRVSCGRHRSELISKDRVYVLEPASEKMATEVSNKTKT